MLIYTTVSLIHRFNVTQRTASTVLIDDRLHQQLTLGRMVQGLVLNNPVSASVEDSQDDLATNTISACATAQAAVNSRRLLGH